MNQRELQHLFWRAGFGLTLKEYQEFKDYSREEMLVLLFNSSASYTPLSIDLSELQGKMTSMQIKNQKDLINLAKKSRAKLIEFNKAWVGRLYETNELLRERMTLFWANHFVCKDKNVLHVQQYNNTLRKYALGDFGQFIKAISKEPAMLKYLNGRQNRKSSPNENFARELMELFTLGPGNYSEKDIKESARAFTGYSHDFRGNFVMRRFQHDFSEKYFLGEIGNFTGDDIIDIILKNKQCAKFICKKLYCYFVNPIPNGDRIEELATKFYSDYNIQKLMQYMLSQDWFYNVENMGVKIKSPIDLLVGLNRFIPFEFKSDKSLYRLQQVLGQTLLDPPNVAGWEGNKAWIDTNTLLFRLKLPSLLYHISLNKSITEDQNKIFNDSDKFQGLSSLKTRVNWGDFQNRITEVSASELKSILLSTSQNQDDVLSDLTFSSSKEQMSVRVMSIPEYQMC